MSRSVNVLPPLGALTRACGVWPQGKRGAGGSCANCAEIFLNGAVAAHDLMRPITDLKGERSVRRLVGPSGGLTPALPRDEPQPPSWGRYETYRAAFLMRASVFPHLIHVRIPGADPPSRRLPSSRPPNLAAIAYPTRSRSCNFSRYPRLSVKRVPVRSSTAYSPFNHGCSS